MLELKDPSLLRQAALVDGEWLGPGADAIQVINPADGSVVGKVPACGASETSAAIAAAKAAWPDWRARTAHERAVLVERWHALDEAARADIDQTVPLARALCDLVRPSPQSSTSGSGDFF